jgi:PKD repeat protein
MMRALSASAQGCLVGLSLAGALLFGLSPAAEAGTSNLKNPTVTFATAGTKQITLQVCNPVCSTVVSQTVTVWDPKPVVSSASFAPLLPEAGQLVFLNGAGTGKPPLAPTWSAAPSVGPPVATLSGTTLWWNTSGVAPGAYTLTFKLQNSAGTATAPLPIVLAPASVLELYTVTPCRIYDSRLGVVPVLSGVAQAIQATGGPCGIPPQARALAANVTVIDPTGGGYAAFYPGNYPQPATSTVTFSAGDTRSNNAILALATNGAGTLTALLAITGANGNANLTIDVTGYFVPSTP